MYKYLLYSVMLFLLWSCDRESNTYEEGASWAQAESKVMMINTLSLKMYTVMKDSVQTSGKSKILVGHIQDNTFGQVTSKSMFELTPESYALTEPTKAVYDSLVMYLTYNDAYYGDTLKTFKLDVFPLQNRVKLGDDGYLYNNSAGINYSASSIGSKSFLPRPNTDSTYVRIPLSEEYGKSLFNLLKTKSVTDQEYFLNFFKGLAVVPSADNNCMLRFGIDQSYVVDASDKNISTLVRLYYHTPTENGTDPVQYTVDLNPSTTYQYNKIDHDFSGSELAGLSPTNPIASSKLGNKSYMMSGLGIYTKITIPYLENIKNLSENYSIISANMYLSPAAGYYNNNFYNPTPVHYYIGNKDNGIVKNFSTTSTEDPEIALSDKGEFQSDYYYTFPITYYLNTVLTQTSNLNYNILIYPTAYSDVMVNKLVVGDQNNATNPAKLKLYLIAY